MKPRVAFFDFAGCEGCQLQIANMEDEILKLIEIVDIVSFREISDVHSDDYDIAFVEGSISRPMDEERLKDIREHADILVALGSCACLGGINKMRNRFNEDELIESVYGDKELVSNPFFNIHKAKSVDEVVKVDYYIPGCPIDRDEFERFVISISSGKKPELPNYPVCVECKKKENPCLFDEGKLCLGPITLAGCNAICPSRGSPCIGCRGILEKPATECIKEIFQRYNIDYNELKDKWNMFNFGDKIWRKE